jgi:hypothetical protein
MGGVCCSPGHYCDNEAENYIRDILKSLKIRNSSYGELKEVFDSSFLCKIKQNSLENVEDPKLTTQGKLFECFKDYLFDDETSRNQYLFFHKLIFDFKSQDKICENPEFYFFTYILSLIKGQKAELVEKILRNDNKLSHEGFTHFLSLYLEANVRHFTWKIHTGFIELKYRHPRYKPKFNGKLAFSSSLYHASLGLEKTIFNNNYLYKLKDHVVDIFDKIVLRLKHENKELKGITTEHFQELIIECPWLFEWDKLRDFFYCNHGCLDKNSSHV